MTNARMLSFWLVFLGLTGPGCAKKGCDDGALDKVIRALAEIREAHTELTSAGVSEACNNADKPMPPGLRAALQAIPQVSPEQQILVAMKAVAESPTLWIETCAGGLQAAASLGALAPRDRNAALVKDCQFEKLGYASVADLVHADTPALILSAMSYTWLTQEGTDKARARKLAVGLLGSP